MKEAGKISRVVGPAGVWNVSHKNYLGWA